MESILKKPRSVRKKKARVTLAEKIASAKDIGFAEGMAAAMQEERARYSPDWRHQKNITDVVRMIESWGNMSEEAVIMIAGTDLKAHCHAAIPLRLLRAIGGELKRLGYTP